MTIILTILTILKNDNITSLYVHISPNLHHNHFDIQVFLLPEEDQKYSDDGFTSDIPDMSMYNNAGPPPQLPVQLSRGILNAETDQSTDPTLLPEPQVGKDNLIYI